MSIAALKAISDSLKSIGINYEFGEWKSEIKYPYFVGEYQETPPLNEDGLQETAFILTGYTRKSWLELEKEKEKIERLFDRNTGKIINIKTVTESVTVFDCDSTIAIYYENALNVPTEDAELKKIQINLSIKEWRVN